MAEIIQKVGHPQSDLPILCFPRRWSVWAGVSILLGSFVLRMIVLLNTPSTITEQANAYIVSFYMGYVGGAIWSRLTLIFIAASVCSIIFLWTVFVPMYQNRILAKRSIQIYIVLTLFMLWIEDLMIASQSVSGVIQYAAQEGAAQFIGQVIPPLGVLLLIINPIATALLCFWTWVTCHGIDREFAENETKWYPPGTSPDWSITKQNLIVIGGFLLLAIPTGVITLFAWLFLFAFLEQVGVIGSGSDFGVFLIIAFIAATHIPVMVSLMVRRDTSNLSRKAKIVKWFWAMFLLDVLCVLMGITLLISIAS